MGSKLYVGNLSYNTTSSELQQMFGPHGTVQSAEVIQDRETNRSKGFWFVLMGSDAEAKAELDRRNADAKQKTEERLKAKSAETDQKVAGTEKKQ